jgi:hypothetical protein
MCGTHCARRRRDGAESGSRNFPAGKYL